MTAAGTRPASPGAARRMLLFTPGHREPGGAGKRSRAWSEGLVARGWQVTVITRSGTTKWFGLRRQPGLTVFEIPGFGLGRLGSLLFLPLAIAAGLVLAWRREAILAIQPSSPATAAAITGRLWRKPVLVSLSMSGELSEVLLFHQPYVGWVRRKLLSGITFLAQTSGAADELDAAVPGARVRVLPNPVELGPVPDLTDQPRAMFVGRFAKEKGLDVLLDAWKEVVAALPAARLALVGAGGSYRSVEVELRARIEADATLRSTVECPGWVPDVERWFARHDVFVLVSRSEGMSNALLEACAAGRVVVASSITENVEVLGVDYPFLVRLDDTDGLRDTLLAALTDDTRRQEARRQALTRAQLFSAENVIRRLEDQVHEAAADRSRHQL